MALYKYFIIYYYYVTAEKLTITQRFATSVFSGELMPVSIKPEMFDEKNLYPAV